MPAPDHETWGVRRGETSQPDLAADQAPSPPPGGVVDPIVAAGAPGPAGAPHSANPADPRSLLSHDEIRELFSPLAGPGGGGGGDPVLILTDRAEDAEIVASDLAARGVAVVYALSRYSAIDLFRQRSYQAVISSPEAWGENALTFLDRFRAVDPKVRFGFICDPEEAMPLPQAMRLQRPLVAPLEALALLAPSAGPGDDPLEAQHAWPAATAQPENGAHELPAGPGAALDGGGTAEGGTPESGAGYPSGRQGGALADLHAASRRPLPENGGHGGDVPVGETPLGAAQWSPTGDTMAVPPPSSAPSFPGPETPGRKAPGPEPLGASTQTGAAGPGASPAGARVTPDPILGIQALLEMRRQHKDIIEGLRAWASRDAAIFGVLQGVSDGADVVYRCWNDDEALRGQMLQSALSGLVGRRPEEQTSPRSEGEFLVFDDPQGGGWVALWLRTPVGADRLAERLDPLLALVGELHAEATTATGGDSRDHFLRLLHSRMKLCERRDSVLGLVVAEGVDPAGLAAVHATVRAVLRESDWTECEGERVYALLEQPRSGVGDALRRRLEESGEGSSTRIVGQIWSPRGLTAAEQTPETLVLELEAALDQNPDGELFHFQEG